jgi:DNA-directed RNA polymerase subunit RPC12/RpoP
MKKAELPKRGLRFFPLLIVLCFGKVLGSANTSQEEVTRMELSIGYECLQCGKNVPRRMVDLAPGAPRQCPDCGAATSLTEGGLLELQRSLEDFCRP